MGCGEPIDEIISKRCLVRKKMRVPAGKQRAGKKKLVETSGSTGGSQSESVSSLVSQDYRRKCDAAERAYEAQRKKDLAIKKCEEMKILMIDTSNLPPHKRAFIERQQSEINQEISRCWNINDVYERIMARMEERLDQFIDQFANRMNDMMNPRRRGDRNGQRNKFEKSENPFFEGDSSSLFAELEECEGDGMTNDNYDKTQVFDDDPYEEEIVEAESMPVYDTDIEDVIEEEEGFVGKGGFYGEEDNIEDIVVVASDRDTNLDATSTRDK
ncbi:hypothetical protein Tco_0296583 [Tanacetum coccineum]